MTFSLQLFNCFAARDSATCLVRKHTILWVRVSDEWRVSMTYLDLNLKVVDRHPQICQRRLCSLISIHAIWLQPIATGAGRWIGQGRCQAIVAMKPVIGSAESAQIGILML
jgi:hypothetical protein